MNILGIDIGTTTITALVLDTKTAAVKKCCTLPNDSFIKTNNFERIQDPQKIIETIKNAVKAVTDGIEIHTIGVTGQMHGILYLNKDFKPCSPLMIWQDGRGNETFENNETYAEYLTRVTGIKAASGFGLTTHFYNLKNNLVPEDAIMLSTIHDYLVALLTNTKPVSHTSDAASLGFFDLKKLEFDENALNLVGIDSSFLPEVIKETAIIGRTLCDFLPCNIPVSVAIGDNQASFLGSVDDFKHSALANVGTGSQISYVTENVFETVSGEIRPLIDNQYIYVGASLCGGRAYAILKNFFSMCADMLGGTDKDLYKKMDKLAETVKDSDDNLIVDCTFCGTRTDPSQRGSIYEISDTNFTPQNLIYGVLDGVASELHDMYMEAIRLSDNHTKLICSGNGLRKSKLWRTIFEEYFVLDAVLPKHSEEAAVGTCVFSSVASEIFKNIEEAQSALLR